MFAPLFQLTPSIVGTLMTIEASRQAIVDLPIDVDVLRGLRETARLATVHYSTKIEGNRLTQEQVEEALAGTHLPGRERDEAEVRHYFQALERIEAMAKKPGLIEEKDLRRVHSIVLNGSFRDSAYRDGQNVIRDAASNGIVYMPPEAKDVPGLMSAMFAWVNKELEEPELPAPVTAALAHYQYATIHPYYDGNGRTARLLTTLILHKTGYGLKGIYSLEEHYASNLKAYYDALAIGPSHNYYLGRADADVTAFIDYFCTSMARAFDAVQRQARVAAAQGGTDSSIVLRELDPRQRRILGLFRDSATSTNAEMATYLRLSQSTMARLSRSWVEEGFLVVANESRKARSYRLGASFERVVAGK